MSNKSDKKKRSLILTLLELLMIVSFIFVFTNVSWIYNNMGLPQKLILPTGLFCLRIIFGLHEIGLALANLLTSLDSVGINGLPLIASVLFVVIVLINVISTDKLSDEVFKIIGSFITGLFAQKVSFQFDKKNNNNHEK